jgi:hypothetical protein
LASRGSVGFPLILRSLSVLALAGVVALRISWMPPPAEPVASPPNPGSIGSFSAPAADQTPPEPPGAKNEPPPSPSAEPQAAAEELPPSRQIDLAAVAAAELSLDRASRDRARAEARAAAAEAQAAAAANQAALATRRARTLAFRIKDPSSRIALARARGNFLRAERDRIRTELEALRTLPRPKAASILTKSPVARPSNGDEFHFELRRNRVSFVNLGRLLELARADAQVRIRMTDRMGIISSQVGPVGSFSLSYVLSRAQTSIDELIERQSIRFDLRGWEVVPESESRGETYQATRNPISEYSRAINRLTPSRAVITMWVYPDSFDLFRRLRDELTQRGFSVAARPLPEGMTIRGSPMGSVSAVQ